jgi:prepilin-type N-terminal cleavage/methylation domain-containing protein/prepilin-type processing-associated H-X9-DG protein
MLPMNGRIQRKRGFTLVELLVTIVVIAILASLFLPSLSAAKEKARSVYCKNNLRQVYTSYRMVADQNENHFGKFIGFEFLPYSADDLDNIFRDSRFSMSHYWVDEFANANPVWICPTAPHRSDQYVSEHENGARSCDGSARAAWRWEQPTGNGFAMRESSYNFNGWFGGKDRGDFAAWTFNTEADIASPCSTPVWADGAAYAQSFRAATTWPPMTLSDTASGDGGFAIPRHGSKAPPSHDSDLLPANTKLRGAINVSFYDGHCEQVPLERLWNLTWHKDYLIPEKRPGL